MHMYKHNFGQIHVVKTNLCAYTYTYMPVSFVSKQARLPCELNQKEFIDFSLKRKRKSRLALYRQTGNNVLE